MSRKVTIYDIARYLKISPASVSYVINGVDKVSKQTRERVLLAIKNVKYQNITVEDASMGKGDGVNTLLEITNVYSSTRSSQHKTTSLGSIEAVEFTNINVLDGKASPAVKVQGCIDPREGYSKEPHIVKDVTFQDFALYGEGLTQEYRNYSSSYAEDIAFSMSGKPITGHLFDELDVSSYGAKLDLLTE